LDRVRRRISWYITPQNRERFSSFHEFKDSWNPNINLWKEVKLAIKDDLSKSRYNASNYRLKSKRENRIMSNISISREISNQNRMNRYINRINTARRK
jgi:hypothetical protein